MPYDYNVNPETQPGVGPYGTVPGPIGIPPSVWDQLTTLDPGLAGQFHQATNVVGNEVQGALSPHTLDALKNASAVYGLESGTVGSQFQGHQGLTQLGLNVEKMQQQGLTDFNNLYKTVGSMQTDPALAAGIAQNNANLAAAPNPTLAAEQAIQNAKDAMAFAYGLTPHTSTATVGGGGTSPTGLPRSPGGGTTTTTTTPGAAPVRSPAGGTIGMPTLPPGAQQPTGAPTDPWNYLADPWFAQGANNFDSYLQSIMGGTPDSNLWSPTATPAQDFNSYLNDIMTGSPSSDLMPGLPGDQGDPLQAAYDAMFGPGAWEEDMSFGEPIAAPSFDLGGGGYDFGGGT